MLFPYKIIDLTHTLDESIPSWSGTCGFDHHLHIDYNDCDGECLFRVMTINMHAGIGTHMDAPSHCIPDGRCVHDFQLQELCMPCVVMDVSGKAQPDYRVLGEDIENFERLHKPIPAGSCVMIETGWSRFWDKPEQYCNAYTFPSVSCAAADMLLERGVLALGIDTLSPDKPKDGFKVHQAFLSKGKILIENVGFLDEMPAIGGFVMILPLKIKNGTEAPLRLVGLIEK